jgi:hypothetical protein
MLRGLDPWHKGLLADREGKSPRNAWAGKWFPKYRYYREVREEVYRRLGKNDGLSEEDIVDRLELTRLSLKRQSIRGLVDGLRVAQGSEPFYKRKGVIDISSELAKQFP